MCKLLKKDEAVDWTNVCAKSWEWMKASMTWQLTFIVPNWNL
jgi:hypothetical protein